MDRCPHYLLPKGMDHCPLCTCGRDKRKSVPYTGAWLPIETAPKDGTAILAALHYRDGTECEPMTIRWHEPWGEWVMSGCLIGIQNSAKDDENADPVFWMPIPTPPQM